MAYMLNHNAAVSHGSEVKDRGARSHSKLNHSIPHMTYISLEARNFTQLATEHSPTSVDFDRRPSSLNILLIGKISHGDCPGKAI
jgi:hypothetical protein